MEKKFRTFSPGLTLTETLIAVTILSVAFLGMMAAFGGISASIQQSKLHTLAANLAQEKMQILKQTSYYRLMVTTSTAYRTEFDPAVPYDTGYYVSETVFEGGITFERLTYVQMAAESDGKLILMGSTPDTGMKAVTVTVLWKQGNATKKVQVRSVRSNPNTVMTSGQFSGNVKTTGNQPIPGAMVVVAENMGWQDLTDNNGSYRISLYPGSYSLSASARGFFPQTVNKSVAANQTVSQDFSLSPMSSGTVTSTVWSRDHLVISQVVASSVSVEGVDQEFVELYNPTTSYIPMAMGLNISLIKLMYQNEAASFPSQINITYKVLNASVAPNSYFLIANTDTVNACGIFKNADAVYMTPGQDIIRSPDAGAVGMQRSSDNVWLDILGWDRNGGGKVAPMSETEGIDQTAGFTIDEQYVRRTSTYGVVNGYGRGYDSHNNNIDFIDNVHMSLNAPPKNSQDNEPCISGTPMIGAIVTANDDLSYPTVAISQGSVPYAEFILTEVATGTWTVLITSDTKTLEVSTVTVTSNGEVVAIPNAVTGPAWQYPGLYACVLSSEATHGYISGRITDAAGMPISPAILVKSGTYQTSANTSSGRYILALATGTFSVTANPNNNSPQYISTVRDGIEVSLGQITSDIDFVLSKGGQLRGWVTRDGINALPGVSIVATDANSVAQGQDISKNDGKFLLINLATGTYTIETVLDSGERSNPASFSATVTAGTSVFVGTFTIAGAFGNITGNVKESGAPISTGVLIVASTSTIVTPPAINASLGTNLSFYTAHSYEDGTFSVDVRGSTTTAYTVYAYYPKLSGQDVVIISSSAANIWVNAGQKKTGINFLW